MATARFTPEKRSAILDLLEVPTDQTGDSTPVTYHLPLQAVRRALDLPPPPLGHLLGPSCWLAGGRVLRWLCGNDEQCLAENKNADFDLFFSSFDTFNATVDALLDSGYTVLGYRSVARTMAERLRPVVIAGRNSGIWTEAGQLRPLTEDLISQLKLKYLEMNGPQGDSVELIATRFSSPLETVLSFDYTICQFAVDDHYLTFGPQAWLDLFNNRLRMGNLQWPISSLRRLIRYHQRGFIPSTTTVLHVFWRAMQRSIRVGLESVTGMSNPKTKRWC